MFRKELEVIFGEQALELGLFYKVEVALRFELSLGGSYIDQFSTAFDRGRTILAQAFEGAERFIFIISTFSTNPPRFSHLALRSLKDCGIGVSRPYEHWYIEQDLGAFTSENRVFIAFEGTKEQIDYALWGALARDLGIKPKLFCSVHIAAPELGILAHPYDDRGMDLIGPNQSRLKSLYAEFDSWLLNYDRERMNKIIGTL